jgi:hypothetical protein
VLADAALVPALGFGHRAQRRPDLHPYLLDRVDEELVVGGASDGQVELDVEPVERGVRKSGIDVGSGLNDCGQLMVVGADSSKSCSSGLDFEPERERLLDPASISAQLFEQPPRSTSRRCQIADEVPAPSPALAHDHALLVQQLDRALNRRAADPELPGKLAFGRKPFAGLHQSQPDLTLQLVGYVLVGSLLLDPPELCHRGSVRTL